MTAIAAAAAAVTLFDKIADQVERFITKRLEPDLPVEHRMLIEEEDGDIVVTEHGQETQRITGDDLAKLQPGLLNHVQVYEQSMENHYSVWSKSYPQLALLDSPIQHARVEAQLEQVIRAMKVDLEGILGFLESAGLYLDDHYLHIRQLVREY